MSSCLVRRRVIARQGANPKQALLTATKEDLMKRISDLYNSINSFSATVDMTPAVGSVYTGEITEYKDVRAYILINKPADIRIIGLYPVVRNKAFDMVSNGAQFRFYLPAKNRFFEGENNAPTSSTATNKLENLRPEAFLDALLIRPVNSANEYSEILDFTDEDNAFYFLLIFRRNPNGDPTLTRNVWFDRFKLQIARQESYDANGLIISDTRYSKWTPYDNVPFPATIDINRPKDGYGVVMSMVKMEMNQPITSDKFVLNQPEGTTLQVLGAAPQPGSAAPAGSAPAAASDPKK